MRLRRGLSAVAVATSMLCACAGLPSRPACAGLPGGGDYCLQSTAELAPFDVQQKIEITRDGRRETLIVQLEVDAQGMKMVGTTPFGQKLLQVGFDNRQIRLDSWPDRRLDPVLLMSLVQIASWPAESVRQGLDDAAALEDSPGMRSVHHHGKPVVLIRYTRASPPLGDLAVTLPAAAIDLDIVNLDNIAAP